MTGPLRVLRRRWRAYRTDTRGAAAVEFALWALFLMIPLLNIADLSFYVYRRMQVEDAAQVAAQAGWATCTTTKLPATDTTKCSGFNTAVSNAVKVTSLGANITVAGGYPKEGYYCATTSGTLQLVSSTGTVGSPPSGQPADCSGVSGASSPSAPPSDYVRVQVTYSYTSVFSGVSVVSVLPNPITWTTWTRMA